VTAGGAAHRICWRGIYLPGVGEVFYCPAVRNAACVALVALFGVGVAACSSSGGGGKDGGGGAGGARVDAGADAGDAAAADAQAGADAAFEHGDAADAMAADATGGDGPASDAATGEDAAQDAATGDAGGEAPDASADAGGDASCAATDTPDNCGSCGMVCPGYLKPNDNVTCASGTTCTFSCQGESYDVDNDPSDGCEVQDTPTGNHTQSSPASGGMFPCDDGASNPNIHGTLVSDKRVHASQAITGFDTASGSAPDWIGITATGGSLCTDDLDLTLQVTGSSQPACYKLTVITNKVTLTAATNASGTAEVSQLSPAPAAYSDNTTIYVEVSKTCTTSVTEKVTYAVTGHL
jgi:hypothetical protein